MAQPLVSICIPTYNGEAYINEALNSAIKQTYANLEIIVSDDNSVDNTVKIIEGMKAKTNIPIHTFKHLPNGIGSNWNHCVTKANGEYIKFLFQDDILEPECIALMVKAAIKNKDIGLVYCKRTFIIEGNNKQFADFIKNYSAIHRTWSDLIVTEGNRPGADYLKDKHLMHFPKNKIGEPTNVLLKTECFKTIGVFNENMHQTLDFEYWYRVMTKYHIAFIDKPLVAFRLHSRQASVSNKVKAISEQNLLFKSYYKHLFWFLHPRNKLKLLKAYHPVVKRLVTLKNTLYGNK